MSDQQYVYVTGGEQRARAYGLPNWEAYHRAIVSRVDLHSGAVERVFDYVSPPDVCAVGRPCVVFKSATIRGGAIFLCTETEVSVHRLPDFHRLRYVSLPVFNDVHHVFPIGDGRLLVASSGLDAIVEVLDDDSQGRIWDLSGDMWTRFSRTADYRRIPSTKPHRVHPNFLFKTERDVWVTRFEQRDAVQLDNAAQRMAIDVERPHDGVVVDDSVYFTTVDGHVVRLEALTRAVREVIDLNELDGSGLPLGWCRGILPVGDLLWVGFSRLRPTRFRHNVSWVRHGFRSVGGYLARPTRLACFSRQRMEHEIILEDHGMNAVFSILPAWE